MEDLSGPLFAMVVIASKAIVDAVSKPGTDVFAKRQALRLKKSLYLIRSGPLLGTSDAGIRQ